MTHPQASGAPFGNVFWILQWLPHPLTYKGARFSEIRSSDERFLGY